jgi:hypothetical protein
MAEVEAINMIIINSGPYCEAMRAYVAGECGRFLQMAEGGGTATIGFVPPPIPTMVLDWLMGCYPERGGGISVK